jgi:predicted nucleic acid-binding protein
LTGAYLDASAILKLTIEEPESLALVDYLAEHELAISTSVVAEVEVIRSLQRLRASRADQDDAIRGFYLVNLDPDVRREALRLEPHHLRALDAIHIASALSINDRDLQFVTYDERQADAARSAGLKVVQPGR